MGTPARYVRQFPRITVINAVVRCGQGAALDGRQFLGTVGGFGQMAAFSPSVAPQIRMLQCSASG